MTFCQLPAQMFYLCSFYTLYFWGDGWTFYVVNPKYYCKNLFLFLFFKNFLLASNLVLPKTSFHNYSESCFSLQQLFLVHHPLFLMVLVYYYFCPFLSPLESPWFNGKTMDTKLVLNLSYHLMSIILGDLLFKPLFLNL